MRKHLFAIVICLLVTLVWAVPAEAQTAGLKFGRVWSEFDGETGVPDTTFERRSAWTAGLFLRFSLGVVSIQPEVLYAQRGTRVDGVATTDEARIETTYVEVPILLRIGSGSTSLFGGGYGALKIDAKAVEEVGDMREEFDLGPDIENFDYGVVFGASIGLGGIDLEGRYTLGLAELFTDPAAPEVKHRALSVLLSHTF